MIYKNNQPSIPLIPYIYRYWHCNSETQVDLFPFFAGTGVELIIHFDNSFYNQEGVLPYAHILCPRKANYIESSGKLDFLAVRFRCGTFRHFSTICFSDLNDRIYSFEDIWGKKGRELVGRLYESKSLEEKVNILNRFFLDQFQIHKNKNMAMNTSIAYIYNNFYDVAISSLVKDMNITQRHFERIFKQEFGITAKKFHRITRFQATVKDLLMLPTQEPLQIALDKGYYDQSHFIKEFKSFSGLLPTEMLKMKNKKYHFYFHKFIPNF